MKAFPLRSGTRQRQFQLLFNIVLEVLAVTIRQKKKKERKEIQIGKKEVKIVTADVIILYKEKSKDRTKKTTRTHQLTQ